MNDILDAVVAIVEGKHFPNVGRPHFGDPLTYPSFNLPGMFVAPQRDLVTVYTMGKDQHEGTVLIYIIVSAKDGFGGAAPETPVDRTLVAMSEDVLRTLRDNITLGGTVATFQSASVQYTPAVRGREAVRMATIQCTYEWFTSRQGG